MRCLIVFSFFSSFLILTEAGKKQKSPNSKKSMPKADIEDIRYFINTKYFGEKIKSEKIGTLKGCIDLCKQKYSDTCGAVNFITSECEVLKSGIVAADTIADIKAEVTHIFMNRKKWDITQAGKQETIHPTVYANGVYYPPNEKAAMIGQIRRVDTLQACFQLCEKDKRCKSLNYRKGVCKLFNAEGIESATVRVDSPSGHIHVVLHKKDHHVDAVEESPVSSDNQSPRSTAVDSTNEPEQPHFTERSLGEQIDPEMASAMECSKICEEQTVCTEMKHEDEHCKKVKLEVTEKGCSCPAPDSEPIIESDSPVSTISTESISLPLTELITHQELHSCDLTIYKDKRYLGTYLSKRDSSITETMDINRCVEHCLMRPRCKSVNSWDKGCALSTDGIANEHILHDPKKVKDHVGNTHVYINCVHPSSGPVACGKYASELEPTNLDKTGANEVTPHTWPWAVGLTIYTDGTKGTRHCVGVLISDSSEADETDTVLVPEHCVSWTVKRGLVEIPVTHIKSVAAGAHNLDHYTDGQQHVQVTSITLSHGPNQALLKVKPPIKFSKTVRPICEHKEINAEGGKCVALSWRNTQGTGPTLTQETKTVTTTCKADNTPCPGCVSHGSAKETNSFCFGPTEKSHIKQDDISSVFVCKDNKDESWVLAGFEKP